MKQNRLLQYLVIAAFLVVALVLGYLYLPNGSTVEQTSAEVVENPEDSPVGLEGSRSAGLSGSEAKATTKPAVGRIEISRAGSGWTIRGMVVNKSKTPLPNAHFTAELFEGYEAKGEPRITANLVTDEAGSFAWPLGPPTKSVTLKFKSHHKDLRIWSLTRVVRSGEPPPQDIVLRGYTFDARVTGRVLDEDDQPIPGAHVQRGYGSPVIECKEDGRYILRVASSRESLFLRAAAPGYSVFRKIVAPPEPGGEIVIDFKMKPALIVQGIVVDEQDRPIEGARIRTFFTIFYKYVPTDAQGRFELDYLERGRSSHTLFARKEGYLESSTQVKADAPKASYKLVLKRGVRCEGRVTAPSGRGIAGARLYIGRDPASYDRLDAVSDEDGHFVFPTVKPGEHDLVTQAQGYASDVRKWKVDAKPGEVSRIVVHLETGRVLAGIIVDKKGKPLADVGVHARVHKARLSSFRRGRYIGERTRTDAEGLFRLMDMAKGKIDVECYGDGVIRHVEEGVSTDIKDLRIVLSRAAQLAGKVVDANTGAPLALFRIRIISGGGTGRYGATWAREGHVFRDSKGYWDSRTENLEEDVDFLIEASAPGYGAVTTTIRTATKLDPDANVIRLMPGQEIVGRVIEAATGAPIPGVGLSLFTAARPLRPGASDDFHGRVTATTDKDGRFTMQDAPVGKVSIGLQHPQWPYVVDGPFVVQAGIRTERVIQVKGLAHLGGTVIDASGKPLAGVTVRALTATPGPGPKTSQRTKTDPEGRFDFAKGFDTGTYTVYVEATGKELPFTVISGTARIQLGQPTELRLQPPGSCEIIGSLECKDPLPESLSVIMRLKTRKPGAAAPAANKVYYAKSVGTKIHIKGLPAGDYDVWVMDKSLMGNAIPTLTEKSPGRVKIKVRRRRFQR